MKIIYAKFVGYIGFYSEMGLTELEIDFSKAKHNICLIVGMNGSGKSTLLNSLNIFPDSSTCFIQNMDASKLLRIVTENGDLYEIFIQSDSDGKGGRKTTKAYISLNGEQLNANGNVSSYRETLFNEFDLDSNYTGLSLLTSTDRGLGDKRPAERKKFVSSIIDNLVTYNDMYKTLNKKSLLYKSHINTLHTKIQSSGNRDILTSTLNQALSKEADIKQFIMNTNNEMVALETKYSIEEEEAQRLSKLMEKKEELEKKKSQFTVEITKGLRKYKKDRDNILDYCQTVLETSKQYKEEMDTLRNEWEYNQKKLKDNEGQINQLESSMSDVALDDSIEIAYFKCVDQINYLTDNLKLNTTKEKDEIEKNLEAFQTFVDTLNLFYDGISPDDIDYLILNYPQESEEYFANKIENQRQKLIEAEKDIAQLEANIEIMSILDRRPEKCHIDTCAFISNALSVAQKYGPANKANRIRQKLVGKVRAANDILKILEDGRERYHNLTPKYELLLKLYELSAAMDYSPQDINNMVRRMDMFNYTRSAIESLQHCLNIIQQRDDEQNKLQLLQVQYDSFKDKKKILESNQILINKLRMEQETLVTETATMKDRLDKVQTLYESNIRLADGVAQIQNLLQDEAAVDMELRPIDMEIEKINSKASKSVMAMKEIQDLRGSITKAYEELTPIQDQISDIKGRLTLLNSYYQEYDQYVSSAKVVDILKKYCSPTGGGIQTVFMQIYMQKTLELSNQILGMLFGGAYRLLDFVINQNEFRIPFIGGGGVPVDDISSGSNSQICMFGMVINLVLLHQASTRYNIAYLDEIDGGLDHRNRFEFIDALYRLIPILGIDQLFLISHSMEADMSAVDVIKLKTYNDFEDTIDMGNVIFDYSQLKQ